MILVILYSFHCLFIMSAFYGHPFLFLLASLFPIFSNRYSHFNLFIITVKYDLNVYLFSVFILVTPNFDCLNHALCIKSF